MAVPHIFEGPSGQSFDISPVAVEIRASLRSSKNRLFLSPRSGLFDDCSSHELWGLEHIPADIIAKMSEIRDERHHIKGYGLNGK